MQVGWKAVWSIPYVSVAFFPSLKQNFIAYLSSKVSSRPDCIFENPQLWHSSFSRVYSNCCCSCSFDAEIKKIGQSSHKIYSNNIVNFQESMTIFESLYKKSQKTYWMHHVVPFAVDTFLPWVLLCLDPTGQKISCHELFSLPSYMKFFFYFGVFMNVINILKIIFFWQIVSDLEVYLKVMATNLEVLSTLYIRYGLDSNNQVWSKAIFIWKPPVSSELMMMQIFVNTEASFLLYFFFLFFFFFLLW